MTRGTSKTLALCVACWEWAMLLLLCSEQSMVRVLQTCPFGWMMSIAKVTYLRSLALLVEFFSTRICLDPKSEPKGGLTELGPLFCAKYMWHYVLYFHSYLKTHRPRSPLRLSFPPFQKKKGKYVDPSVDQIGNLMGRYMPASLSWVLKQVNISIKDTLRRNLFVFLRGVIMRSS